MAATMGSTSGSGSVSELAQQSPSESGSGHEEVMGGWDSSGHPHRDPSNVPHPHHLGYPQHTDYPSDPHHPHHLDYSHHPDHPNHPHHPDHTNIYNHPHHPQHPRHLEYYDPSPHTHHPDRYDHPDHPDHYDHPHHPHHSDPYDHPHHPHHPNDPYDHAHQSHPQLDQIQRDYPDYQAIRSAVQHVLDPHTPPRRASTPGSPGSPSRLPHLQPGTKLVEARLSSPSSLPRMQYDQHRKLEERFRECRSPTPWDVALIAAEVGVEEEDVTVWFQHRLALWRRQQGLPANEKSVCD